ncbi:MAG: hypothetical protein GF353_28595 [Candidatus Lokiarchaeota archaeon]|nr:hypothetical protein [Candidatus Lokiarchaeota archaeon]MBD3353962.1 hypothetical protein [Candidatus Lokiarchaeota archaeon]
MQERITYKVVFRIALNITFIGVLLFLMFEVIWAQLLKDLIIDRSGSNDYLLTGIILGGFLLSAIISIISSLLSSNKIIRKYSLWAALIGFIVNLFLWILICYIAIILRYPEITQDLNILEKIIAIPIILAYFSIYFLSNVTLLWIISLVTYALIFSIVLYLLSRKKSNKNYAYSNWEL